MSDIFLNRAKVIHFSGVSQVREWNRKYVGEEKEITAQGLNKPNFCFLCRCVERKRADVVDGGRVDHL